MIIIIVQSVATTMSLLLQRSNADQNKNGAMVLSNLMSVQKTIF